MTAEVGLGQMGIVLGLEVSRLARNNADWYRLLDLCGLTHTLIGDGDGIYHPGLFNDRLVLGLKGTMSEAELHVLRARLLGGNPQQGRTRRTAPRAAGGSGTGRRRRGGCCILTSRCKPRSMLSSTALPNSARHDACGCGSARTACAFRCTPTALSISAGSPLLTKIHQVLPNPFYAGVYVYGRTQQTCYLDAGGRIRKRIRQRDREQ